MDTGLYLVVANNKIQTKNKNDNENSIADFDSLENAIKRCDEIEGAKIYHIFTQICESIHVDNILKYKVHSIAVEIYPKDKSNSVYNVIIFPPKICDEEDRINKENK